MNLSPHELSEWQNRFFMFNDAVIRSWRINLTSGAALFEIKLDSQDSQSILTKWSSVTLTFRNCSFIEFNRSEKLNYDVLSNGIHFLYENGLFGIELGDYIDAPSSIPELLRSLCCVVAQQIDWSSSEI